MKLVALHLQRTYLLIRVVGVPSNLFDQRLVDSFSRFHCIHKSMYFSVVYSLYKTINY